MTIENCASLEEAVQPVDEIESPKKSFVQKYRYLLVAALLCPGSFMVPLGCATYAYNHFKDTDAAKSDDAKSGPETRNAQNGLFPTPGVHVDGIGGK